MATFEVANHQTVLDLDIIACGERLEVNTWKEAVQAFEDLVGAESHPVVAYHIDGEVVSCAEFRQRLKKHELEYMHKGDIKDDYC